MMYLYTLEASTLMPACFVSHPNSVKLPPTEEYDRPFTFLMTDFSSLCTLSNTYFEYVGILVALNNHAAPQISSSYTQLRNCHTKINTNNVILITQIRSVLLTYLIATKITIKWTNPRSKSIIIGALVCYCKLKYLIRAQS